jgi:hypothetical protein
MLMRMKFLRPEKKENMPGPMRLKLLSLDHVVIFLNFNCPIDVKSLIII